MSKPVSPSLPKQGLLVGWSLEEQQRKPLIGFAAGHESAGVSPAHLEPILHTGEGHLITVAPTGAGKGVGCIIPALLRYPGPVVVIDPKGENYRVTARRRRELGQQVIALDPFGISGAPHAERGSLNPLDYLSTENASLVEDAEMLATSLMSMAGSGNEREPFWPHMGAQLLTLLMLYQIKTRPPEEWTLMHTRDLLARNFESFQSLGSELLKSDDEALRRLAGLLLNPAAQTFGGYWAHAQMQTGFLKGELISRCISTSSFSLGDLTQGKPISIYIVLPPSKLEAYGGLLRLWLTVMMAALTQRRSRPEHATLFLVDEAAQLGPMPQLRQAITLLRGYGVRVWSFWQDLSQIKGLYPQTWQTLLNNCQVQQYFGQSNRLAAEQVFEVTGLGSADYLQGLRPGEMALSLAGDVPVVAQAPNYLLDASFAGLYDGNPLYCAADLAGLGPPSRVFRRSEVHAPEARRHFEQATALQRALKAAQGWHPVACAHWESVEGQDRDALVNTIRDQYHGLDETGGALTVKRWPLRFYDEYDYYEITQETESRQQQFAYCLSKPGRVVVLSGSSEVIQNLNEELGLQLKREDISDYLYLYCSSLAAEEGRFLIIDDLEEDLSFREALVPLDRQTLQQVIQAPAVRKLPSESANEKASRFDAVCTLLYGNTLSRATFRVETTGRVDMVKEQSLFTQLPVVTDADRKLTRLNLRAR